MLLSRMQLLNCLKGKCFKQIIKIERTKEAVGRVKEAYYFSKSPGKEKNLMSLFSNL